MRRHLLAAVAEATAPCGGSAGGDEVSADEPVCDDSLVWTGEVANIREVAQLMTNEAGTK